MSTTIDALEDRVNALEASILQMQRNLTPVIDKTDQTASSLVVADDNIEKNTADIDYIAMMTEVELPDGSTIE